MFFGLKCLLQLHAEPKHYIETWEDKEDDYLAHAVYEHMQLSDKKV